MVDSIEQSVPDLQPHSRKTSRVVHSQDDRGDDDPRVRRTKADIARTVQELFIADGWDAITHHRVAEHAGYGRNTVYRHFPDRTALLLHGGRFDAVHHAAITGDLRTDLIAELTVFRRELFEGIVGRVIAAMVERAGRDPEVQPMRDELVSVGSQQTAHLIEVAIAAGRMDGDIAVVDHVANLCGPLVYARLCQDRPPDDRAIEHLVDTHLGHPGPKG